MINTVVGFFVGENSKKRQIAIVLGLAIIALNMMGMIDDELTRVLLQLDGLAFGMAVAAKLTKMHNAIRK